MQRVAVFGNAGGGKSRLARRLAELTGLPLHTIDMLQFRAGGEKVPHEEYLKVHADLMQQDRWIIDGFDGASLAWQRFAMADTLVYVDLPLVTHVWFVTKRLAKGLFAEPPGWPPGSPVWSSSMQSYKVLWPCHVRLTPKYRQLVAEMTGSKRVHHLTSRAAIAAFIEDVKWEYERA